jgi:hypothetical protein
MTHVATHAQVVATVADLEAMPHVEPGVTLIRVEAA